MSSTLSRILTKKSNSGIKSVKQIRDDLAGKRLASYLERNIPNIKKKEELFSQYLDTLDEVYESSNNKPADSDLSAVNEFWGMWLLGNYKENKSILDLKNKLSEDLKTAMQKLRQRDSPSSNLHHYTAFGNDLRKKGHLAESIEMYTKAIHEGHCWAAIAYYNRAFASLTRDRHQDPNCIDQALEDLRNALESVEFYHTQIKVTHTYSAQEIKDPWCNSITRFDKQMGVRYEMLKSFKGNITEAIKKLEKARDNAYGDVKVHKKQIKFPIPPEHYFSLKMLQMTLIFTRDPLKIHQLINNPFYDFVIELKRLRSLGLTRVYTIDI
ncbi:uncharacterized protein LOC141760912 [Sebastes fasciatus]|uniref:uncharacterized protein LOC141760912 n=1 Tax=Sebastes fasciatus TaxID=394691 RepID=UPI003D9F3407